MQTYMLDMFNDPKCMHPDCKKTWTMDHMFSIMPKSFINGKYKKHRETVLYNREVAMLPATQPHLVRTNALNILIEKDNNLAMRIKELQNERALIKREISILNIEFTSAGPAATKVVQQYAGRCGNADCKGFVNMKGYACGICETKYCDKCFAIEETDHVCNPDDVLTFEAMRKDSKPCPTCAASIHRTSGCPMMFCTQCNTAWDWNTFKITTNEDHIHNPHYFEWRAANPHLGQDRAPAAAAAAALQCAENLTTRQVDAATAFLHRNDRRHVLAVWGMIEHVSRTIIRRFEVFDVPIFERNKDIRIKFLSNATDEKRFKSLIHTREKALNKKREICQILKTFVAVSKECMFEFVHNTDKNVQDVLSQYQAVTKFTDESLAKASARYNCVVPSIAQISEARGL
jgi:hypothetical protein